MELRRLQREMQNELLGEASSIEAQIADAPPLTPEGRLGIYRNAYVSRLIESLQNYYPVLHQTLGDEDFAALGAAFVRAHPSVHRSIRWYGRELPAFLQAEAPFAEQPIFAELARFEWSLAEAFDSADEKVLGRAALSGVEPAAWAEMKFRFHPSVQRLTFEWNTAAVWKALSAEESPPAPERSPEAVEWLVWRRDLENYFRSLDSIEVAAIDAALRGSNFAHVCAALTQHLREDEVPLRAASLIATWLDGGLLTGLVV